ncbi:MAG: hypothetical protein NTX73_03385 [Rhodobacterales bacterium]|nr:hypothetical protein [Rhodobacterales bacterium]
MASPFDAIAQSLLGRLQRLARSRAQTIVLYVLAGMLVHVAIIVALVTAAVPLAARVGGIWASVILTGLALLIAVVLVMIAGARDRAAKEREQLEAAQQRQMMNIVATVLPMLKSRDTLLLGAGLAMVLWLVGQGNDKGPEA